MLHFIFPEGRPGQCDELFADQKAAVEAAGHSTSLLSNRGEVGPRPAGRTVVYRGWMQTGEGYRELAQAICAAGGTPLTTLDQYLATHHLPNWYPALCDM